MFAGFENRSKQIDEERARFKQLSYSNRVGIDSELLKVKSPRLCLSRLTDTHADAENRARERVPSSRSKVSSRQVYLFVNQLTDEAEEGYIPSWCNNRMPLVKLNKPELNDQSPKSSLPEQLSLDYFQSLKAVQKKESDAKTVKHSELEKEYFKVRKRIYVKDDAKSDVLEQHSEKDAVLTAKTPTWLGVKSGNIAPVVPHSGIFDSDSLGMNHFQKHVLNVKTSSKRYKRAQRKLEQNGHRRVQFKFKPLYERRQSEDCVKHGDLTSHLQ